MAQGFTKEYLVKATGETTVLVNGTVQASTSGTEIDFTIPAGVKEVKIMFDEVSTTSTSNMLIQLGDSGGIEATNYKGGGGNQAGWSPHTTGFGWHNQAATNQASGAITLSLMDAATNLWVASGATGDPTVAAQFVVVAGSKALSGELTTVRLTTVAGTATFDNGSVNIQYEAQDLDLGSGVISGGVVQTVNTQDGEVANTATAIPADDTIPQNTEGGEFMTASITPTDVANKLKIEVVVHASNATTNRHLTAALFQDSIAGAIAVGTTYETLGTIVLPITFTYWMDAGTTSSTTFKVRGGSDSGTFTFNGKNGTTRQYGGVLSSSISITEYKV